jgi:signal transduction histidine kinase
VRSAIAVVLAVGGECRGVVQADSATPEHFTQRDLAFLEAVAGWLGLIAQRAELIEQLTAQAAEQGRRAAADELITVLAHDLRNHLTPLKGRIDLLRRRAGRENRPADLADAEAAATALARLNRLIGDLLDVGRLEQGIFTVSPQPVDLAALAHDAAATLRGGKIGIRVQTPEEVVCQVDPDRFRQALENLLANAVKHSPAGGAVTLQVATLARGGDQAAVITVADEGPGIPPELLPRLFERFTAGPGSTGLGLGLYLASRIAAAHGGTLTVDSAPGHGARFALSLPCEGPPGETGGPRPPLTAP